MMKIVSHNLASITFLVNKTMQKLRELLKELGFKDFHDSPYGFTYRKVE